MSTSKPKPQAPSAPAGGLGSSSYTRFIPREELGKVSAWNLETFETPPPAPVETGVRKLQEIAKLNDISLMVPVTFNVEFKR